MRILWNRTVVGFLIFLALGGATVADTIGAASTLSALDAGIAQRRAIITAHHEKICDGIGELLAQMVDLDQFTRFSMYSICPSLDKGCVVDAARRLLAVDADNLALLRPIIARYGWHELKNCGGKDAQHNVWLLVQHADRDKPFQRAVLDKMRQAFLMGEVSAADYAYLVDRVASGDKEPQTFGTQGTCDGTMWKPDPLLAPNGLDERRHEVGLEPETDYAADAASALCKKP